MTEASIYKFLPKEFYETAPRNVPAILGAINKMFDRLESLTQGCIDQGFIQTSTGRYLIQLGEEQGFVIPPNSGLDIRAYRALIPVMVADPKQVRPTINNLLKSFYTSDKTNSGLVSTTYGPYVLLDGDDIIIETENGTVNIGITASQVANLNNVSTAELASIINTNQQFVIATQRIDRSTARTFLALNSNTTGTSSKLRLAGGKLQNILKFPTLVETLNAAGTTWFLSKPNSFSDELTFTWNGLGTNPNVFLGAIGDVITIRGLVDGVDPWSNINGSYTVKQIGYDYFTIQNTSFTALSSTLTQPDDNNILFTSSAFLSLYNREEYAFTTEVDINTVRMTAPAIPPLSRRFLSGSTHYHGMQLQIIDFSRNSVTLQTNASGRKPDPVNAFLFASRKYRLDARHPYYRTESMDSNLVQPTYQLNTLDPNDAVFPFTVPAPIGTNPILATVRSAVIKVDFPFPHGFEQSWATNLNCATGSSNYLTTDLNTEHVVSKVISPTSLEIVVKNPDGTPKLYSGTPFGPVDVFRYPFIQDSGADMFMTFATVPEASVFTVGLTFRFSPAGGIDIISYLSLPMRYIDLVVTDISGTTVSFNSGLGAGPEGVLVTGLLGARSAYIGGVTTHYLDKLSPHNQSEIFDNMVATFLGYNTEVNPAYVSAYIYDPSGVQTTVTVSRYVVNLKQDILKGDTFSALEVNSITTEAGESFPQNGLIVLDYGRNAFEGPVRYYATAENISSSQIIIDPAYRFKKAHKTGASVQFIHKNQTYTPGTLGHEYPTYITGTAQARNTMFLLAESLVAAGVFIEQNVLLPELKYADTAIIPFE